MLDGGDLHSSDGCSDIIALTGEHLQRHCFKLKYNRNSTGGETDPSMLLHLTGKLDLLILCILQIRPYLSAKVAQQPTCYWKYLAFY